MREAGAGGPDRPPIPPARREGAATGEAGRDAERRDAKRRDGARRDGQGAGSGPDGRVGVPDRPSPGCPSSGCPSPDCSGPGRSGLGRSDPGCSSGPPPRRGFPPGSPPADRGGGPGRGSGGGSRVASPRVLRARAGPRNREAARVNCPEGPPGRPEVAPGAASGGGARPRLRGRCPPPNVASMSPPMPPGVRGGCAGRCRVGWVVAQGRRCVGRGGAARRAFRSR